MDMKELIKDNLINLLSAGRFPNNKNRVWTMCQVVIKLLLQTIEEAEKNNLTNEQFYISFLDSLNALTLDDKISYINSLHTFRDDSI